MLIHPSGKYLYLTTGSAANGVLGWSIDPTSGSLTALGRSPFAPGTFAGGGVFESAGRFLYSTGAGGTISTFSADPASGALTMAGASQAVTGANFSAPVIDASGSLLIAGGGPQKSIVGFRLNAQTRGLTMVGAPAPIGGVPGMLAIVNAP